MKILPADKLPKTVVDVPTDNLIELYKVCLQMEMACLEANGVGLSAVQIGIPWKLFIAKNQTGPIKFRYFVNVEYDPVPDAGKQNSVEACLSITDSHGQYRYFKVDRHEKVALKGTELVLTDDLKLVPVDGEVLDGLPSVVVQHEADHHSGILISEIGQEVDVW